MEITINLTIYFEGPFWVGVFERKIDEFLEVARVVFGTEPKAMKFMNSLSRGSIL